MVPESTPGSLQAGDPRLIVQWARHYAKSRTISFLVQWVFILIMALAIGMAGSLTNIAYRAHNTALFSAAVVTLVLTILLFMWFSVSKWGGEFIWRITQWMYGEEGYVTYLGDRKDGPTPWWITVLSGTLVIYHLVGALLVGFNYLQINNLQPYSAAYMVPFLGCMILYQRLGFWAWLWPGLYALHALLLLAHVPVGLPGRWQMLTLLVSAFGCGLLAILAGHAFSRYALWKLKRLARTGLPNLPEGEDEGP